MSDTMDTETDVYFKIQTYTDRGSGARWCETSQAPNCYTEGDDRNIDVWKAYLAYLALVYPEPIRLVQVTVATTNEVIHWFTPSQSVLSK